MNARTCEEANGHGRSRPRRQGRLVSRAAPTFCVLLCVIFLGSPWAQAAEILLTNGDRITGTIMRSTGDAVRIKSPDAKDTIEVPWKAIKGFNADTPITIELRDHSRVTGGVTYEEGVGLHVRKEDGSEIVVRNLTDIATINVPPIEYKGQVRAGGTYNAGDSSKMGVTAGANFSAETRRQKFIVRGSYEYGEDSGQVSARNALGVGEYRFYMLPKRLFTYASAEFLYDSFQSLDLRSTVTLGLGYQIFDNNRTSLSVGFGPAYLNAQYVPPNADISAASGSWQLDFSLWIIEKKIRFYHLDRGSFPFDDTSLVNAIFDQGLEFKIVANFGASANYRLDFNNAPAIGKEKLNQFLAFNLTYDFDF